MHRFRTLVAVIAVSTALSSNATAADAAGDTVCLIRPITDVVGVAGFNPLCVDLAANGSIEFDEVTGGVSRGMPLLAAMLGLDDVGDEVFTLGFDFHDPEFGRPRLRWVTENYDRCNSETAGGFYARSMPKRFRDNVSSAKPHLASGCFHFLHYEHAGFDGAVLDCAQNSCYSTMGAMDDETSSIYFY